MSLLLVSGLWARRGQWGVLVGACVVLSACVNEAGYSQRYPVFDVQPEQLAEARKSARPYVYNKRGYLQTVEPIEFQTEQWGPVLLTPNFVSDGSSLPFDRDPGSNMAALLHDALYRGAPQLTFSDGYPGRWTRQQADDAYCLQLQRQGAKERRAKLNCKGLNILGLSRDMWQRHTAVREAYWERQERIQ